jgi:hypothetical protein
MNCGQTLWSNDLTPKPIATLYRFSQRVTRANGPFQVSVLFLLHVHCYEEIKARRSARWHGPAIEIVQSKHAEDANRVRRTVC